MVGANRGQRKPATPLTAASPPGKRPLTCPPCDADSERRALRGAEPVPAVAPAAATLPGGCWGCWSASADLETYPVFCRCN